MEHNKSFSLSLQKEIEKRNLFMDSEINKAFKELKLKSLLKRSGIKKHKGYPAIALLYLIILLPFFKKYMSSLWLNNCFIKQFDAQKDTYYRFLNHERFKVKAVFLNVMLPCSGEVRILFVSDGKKQWHAFLSTDLELNESEILSYYARRWAIEVFFKDAKQMLYLGKEQSETFDAVVT